MASKFTAGMKNVVEVLNQMWDAFAAGPYNALPLTGGNLTGPVTTSSTISAHGVKSGNGGIDDSHLAGGVEGQANGITEALRLGVRGLPGAAYPGFFSVQTLGGRGTLYKEGYLLTISSYDSGSAVFSQPLLSLDGYGRFTIPVLKANSTDPSTLRHNISRGAVQGEEILYVGVDGHANPSIAVLAADGTGGWASSTAVLFVGRNSTTGRGITTGGTIAANGADYAEYMIKSLPCNTIIPGQIVGIDVDGRLTDQWNLAIAFVVKSTNPCMVGGDSWAQHLGARPAAPNRIAPTVKQVLVKPGLPANEASGTDAVPPVYDSITTAPGDTDDEWAAKQAAHEAALSAFEVALEAARQKVDRIAFAGQVPVNVQGATPGQYIVPVQQGEGIGAISVNADDLTLTQYMRAVGKVIAVEDDGRARIVVKVA